MGRVEGAMEPADLKTIQAMQRWGGSFVQALAGAALRADSDNLARLKAAWPEYWTKYRGMGESTAEEDE